MPTEEQRDLCAGCGHAIIWYFDRNLEAELLEHGLWYDAETMTEDCDVADDAFHAPAE